MKPQEHKQAVMQAFMRCRRDYGLSDNGVADFEKELDSLLAHYQACIAHNEMLLARLRLEAKHKHQSTLARAKSAQVADFLGEQS